MNKDLSTWARQHADTLTADDLSTAFRELQQAQHAAGWKRNLLYAGALLLCALLVAWAVVG